MSERKIEIVFDGPPSHEAGRFVEVEQNGKSIKCGEWREGNDSLWYLTLPDVYDSHDQLGEALKKNIETLYEFQAGLELLGHNTLAKACNVVAVANRDALKAAGEEVSHG